ncbi:MAG: hypothetical protein CENE_03023 [Candidatus Celerinatantimonas neptuna]|nr:MAG: hypothetical protein CENE_03023 [Candidatus Celerinatantimonas neptuna]
MKACQSGDKQACAQKTKELVAYEKTVDEEDIDAEYPQYNLGGYSLLGIDKALGKQLTSVSNIGKDATGVVKHFVLKRNSRQGAVKSVLDTGGAVLAGAAVVGGCVATGGIPCLIGATAGGLGAFNSANYLYGDAQQAWTGKAHSTALISTAKRLGASSSTAGTIQRGFDMATAGTAALDLGVGAFSLASGTARVLNGADRMGSNVEELSASARQAISLDVPTSKSTIQLNAVNSQTGERLANIDNVSVKPVHIGESASSGILQGELKYPGIERLPESTTKVGDGVTGTASLEDVVTKGADNIPLINGRKPINSQYAGRTHPSGVKFNNQGFPDFSPYSKAQVDIKGLTGNYAKDAAMANKAVGLKSTPDGYVWHHVENAKTMQLVPKDIHNAARHTGGAAVLRNQ